jgi:Zn-dependent protease with chaperone function
VLTLGLPLFELLDADRRVALIAHELAHGRNGDQRRGLVVGSALSTLEELYLALTPRETMLRYTGLAAGELLGNLLGWLLSQPVKWLLYLELHLLLHDMQRAEYLADALAASAAGTDAMISLHETLLMSSVVSTTLARAAREQRDPGELFDQMRDDIDAVPARERERRIRAAEQEGTKLGSTHPPTAMRIDLLRSRPAERRRVTLTPEASHRIDVELDEKLVSCAQRLLDRQRDSLYAR